MKNLYIDFDGVILDTMSRTYEEMKKIGIDKNDQEEVMEFFRKVNWQELINNTKPINDSINEIINMFN